MVLFFVRSDGELGNEIPGEIAQHGFDFGFKKYTQYQYIRLLMNPAAGAAG